MTDLTWLPDEVEMVELNALILSDYNARQS